MHPELRAAFEADDRERAEHEVWQYRWNQRMVRRDASAAGIVYKINPNALCDDAGGDRPQLMTDEEPDESDETAATRGFVVRVANQVAEIGGSEDGILERELRAEIAKLEKRIETLEAKSNGARD